MSGATARACRGRTSSAAVQGAPACAKALREPPLRGASPYAQDLSSLGEARIRTRSLADRAPPTGGTRTLNSREKRECDGPGTARSSTGSGISPELSSPSKSTRITGT